MSSKEKKSWYHMSAMGRNRAEAYIYDFIGDYGVTANDFARDLKALGDVNHIDLHISSLGGDVFQGTAMHNLLKRHQASVEVWIDGVAASMATVIAMAGDKINIAENAHFMVHNPSTIAWGDARVMEKARERLEKTTESLVSAYAARSGIDAEEVRRLMDEETWYLGAEAVEAGFADEMTDSIEMQASYNLDLLSQFKHVPDIVLQAATEPPARGVNVSFVDARQIAAGLSVAPGRPEFFSPSAVADNHPPQKETITMDPITETPVATADAAVTPEIKAQIEADATKAAKAEFAREESQRKQDIRAVFEGFAGHDALQASCLDDLECDAAAAKDRLLQALGQQTPEPAHNYGIVVRDAGGMAKLKSDAENAISARAFGEKVIENNGVAGYSLMEIARTMLQARMVDMGGMDKMSIVAAAFTHTSGDFANVLGNIANKAMLKGYEEAAEVFPMFTASGNLSDFKIQTRVDLGQFPSLRQVAEGAEYKYVTLGERAETAVLATYGELFSITRQGIINDDLSMFTRLPAKMGRAAIRTVGDLVFNIFINNPNMADGNPVFDAAHNNLLSASAINTASIDAARVAMATQKDGPADLNIRPSYLLCDVSNEGAAKVALESEFEVGASTKNNTVPNSVRGIAQVISDARLQSHNGWYLLANQNMHDTIEVLYLDGNQSPTLEQQSGWNVDGVEFKVRMDAAAKAWDYRGMVKTPLS